MFGVRAGDLRRFGDLVSPSFFDVVPIKSLWSQGRDLLASMNDTVGFSMLCQDVEVVLRRLEVPVRIGPVAVRSDEVEVEPQQRGQWVLQTYFAQLAHLERAALDLRPGRFVVSTTVDRRPTFRWNPRPLGIRWDPQFLAGVRGLYTGFYRDDPGLFEHSAEALGLSAATDLFRAQFGDGDQTAVRFDLDRFKQSFHAIFVRCKEHGATLHPNFVALGIYLGGLYEHLDGLGVPMNVRAAFDAVWPVPAPGLGHHH